MQSDITLFKSKCYGVSCMKPSPRQANLTLSPNVQMSTFFVSFHNPEPGF